MSLVRYTAAQLEAFVFKSDRLKVVGHFFVSPQYILLIGSFPGDDI